VDELDEMYIDGAGGVDTDDIHDLMFWCKGIDDVMEWEKPKGN